MDARLAPVPELADGALHVLERSFRGTLIRPADQAYGSARRVFNGMIDRYPALIASCAGTRDVASAIRLAREHGLPLAVRGGGHNVAGHAVCDNGVMIDLSPMCEVTIDPRSRTARAGGGVTWGGFDRSAHGAGLATTGGLVSTTGIAGLTLGGGMGWLMRRCGLSCDNLAEAEVVTADGAVVTASEEDNPDLLWALRGGGGNFGVVTSFTYRLHPVTTVLGGLVLHEAGRAGDVLAFYRDYASAAPDELSLLAAFLTAPPEPFVPAHLAGQQALAIVACYAGEPAAGEKVLAPLRSFGPPAADVIGPMPYPVLQSMFDPGAPPGLRNYWRSGYLAGLGDGIRAVIAEHAPRAPSPYSQVHVQQLGGAVARVPASATAYSHRDAAHVLHIVGMWDDPADDEANLTWLRDFWAAAEPYTAGAYVNFLGQEGDARTRAAYGTATWERLAAVKARWDPANLFRGNHNIRPAPAGPAAADPREP